MHKDNAFVCILDENSEKIEFKTEVLTIELDSFRDKLIELGVGEVAMESAYLAHPGERLQTQFGEPAFYQAVA